MFPSFSRLTGGAVMSTAMSTVAPSRRAVSTGKFTATPPSTKSRPSISTGVRTPGNAMLARTAVARSPPRRTTPSPFVTSVTWHRNGIGSRSKSVTSAVGRRIFRRMKASFCPSTRPDGRASFPLSIPTTSFVRYCASSSFLRKGRSTRGTLSTNASSQSIAASVSSISCGDIPDA